MKNNSNARLATISEIEKSLLDNPGNLYFGSDFNTEIIMACVPCKVVATSKALLRVIFKHDLLTEFDMCKPGQL